MTIEMVLAEIDEDTDRWIERRGKIDLIGRDLDDMRHGRARRLEREDRGADIAADLGLVPGAAQEMRGKRGGGRFAVGPGDGDERRVRSIGASLTAKQLDVADDLDGGIVRETHRPVRRRVSERHARGKHQCGNLRPVDLPQIGGRDAGAVRLATVSASSSQPTTSAPPASSALALARPEPPRPNMASFFPAKMVTGIMLHRSLSVDSPASASTTATIQKRITICGSVQPSCSKWW